MSRQSLPILTLPMTASGSVAGNRFVTPLGAQAAANSPVLGVSRNAALDTVPFPLDVLGTTIVETGGQIASGDWLAPDSQGRAVTASDGSSFKTAIITGGAAGNHTLTGIAVGDKLVSVIQLDVAADTGTSATGNKIQNAIDLTAEFSVTAANTINTGSGTSTSGDLLLVVYGHPQPLGGVALQAASGAGKFVEMLLLQNYPSRGHPPRLK